MTILCTETCLNLGSSDSDTVTIPSNCKVPKLRQALLWFSGTLPPPILSIINDNYTAFTTILVTLGLHGCVSGFKTKDQDSSSSPRPVWALPRAVGCCWMRKLWQGTAAWTDCTVVWCELRNCVAGGGIWQALEGSASPRSLQQAEDGGMEGYSAQIVCGPIWIWADQSQSPKKGNHWTPQENLCQD